MRQARNGLLVAEFACSVIRAIADAMWKAAPQSFVGTPQLLIYLKRR